ncbi:MAG: phytoene desaturase family protein [Mycobacteriaceae bacterium]
MVKAIVVGSGPNGLAAAIKLGLSGIDVTVLEGHNVVGGGMRSCFPTLPGVLHDECSAFHPFATQSRFAKEANLSELGLQWGFPEIQYAHPLEGGVGASVYRSIEDTASLLGDDARSYKRLFTSMASDFDRISENLFEPIMQIPNHPLTLAKFGLRSLLSAQMVARRWEGDSARALWAGVAAHAFRPLDSGMSSAVGFLLGVAAHRYGWPVAIGGSERIADAMKKKITSQGGKVETGVWVKSISELEDADIVLLDTTPAAAADILGERLNQSVAKAYRNFKHGPGAFQISFAVEGGIPWTYLPAREAGTVHVGGSFEEIAYAEKMVTKGHMPSNPFVLVGQQYVADPSRRSGSICPIDAYAHVPQRWSGDGTQIILNQIERFAPKLRERIVEISSRSVQKISTDNPNFVGGDILTGANMPKQLLFRPRISLNPYRTGIKGIYLCSAATAPGPGAHGMCGYNAARTALDDLR